jgi:hypothetical protein
VCCFPVIYFVSNIPFLARCWSGPRGLVETGWLICAVKNTWQSGGLPSFAGLIEFAGL